MIRDRSKRNMESEMGRLRKVIELRVRIKAESIKETKEAEENES